MAHFAKIDENNIVTKVIVASQETIDTQDGTWIQTSYNTYGGKHYNPETQEEDSGTPLRKNFAGIGYTYDSEKNAFIPPTPFPSWTLDETTCLWEAPVSYPTDDKMYNWDDENQQWKVWTIEE